MTGEEDLKDREIKPGSPEWHQRRRDGVGGSSIAQILGVDTQYGNIHSCWLYNKGRDEPEETSAAAARGTMMEPHVLSRMEKGLGCEILPGIEFHHHPKWEEGVRILANSDGRVPADEGDRSIRIVEAKTAAERSKKARVVLAGRVPMGYWLQCHAYMSAFDADYTLLGTIIGPWEPSDWHQDVGRLYILGMRRDPWIEKVICGAVKAYWQKFVEPDIAPVVDEEKANLLRIRIQNCYAAQTFDRIYREPGR